MSAFAFGALGALSLREKSFVRCRDRRHSVKLNHTVRLVAHEQRETSQGQSHGVLVDRIAVFAVIQQCDPKAVLGQIGPFVTPNLKMRKTAMTIL